MNTCLKCKYYKIHDAESGFCRVEALSSGNHAAEKPLMQAENTCKEWADCGQTYYIRLGWLKNNSKQS